MLNVRFEAEIIHWRGPAPFYFAQVPQPVADQIAAIAKQVSYGWGVIPVSVTIGTIAFTTSLFPRDGSHLVPLKDAVRKKLDIPDHGRLSLDLTITGRNSSAAPTTGRHPLA